MAKNLKYQFFSAINDPKNLKIGASKHSAKAMGQTGSNLIFSYSDKRNLLNLSGNFSNYIRKNFPTVKFIQDIQTRHILSFLDEKAKTCSTNTLKLYVSNFNKLTKITNKTYHLNKKHNLKTPIGYSSYVRNICMSDDDFNTLLASCSPGSTTYNALYLAKSFGCRVSELAKLKGTDIREISGKFYLNIVDSKGKKSRLAPCSHNNTTYLKELQNFKKQRLINIHHSSINQNIRRHLYSTGLGDKYSRTSIHAIRKNYAQTIFDDYRTTHSKQDSLHYVSKILGHGGDNRSDIIQIYLTHIY